MTSASNTTPTVFVVDDDQPVRKALERLFQNIGWPVQTFASAEEFLQQDLAGVTGCVIVDVHLGRMRGFDLQAALGQRADPLPIILMTGVDDVEAEIEGRRLGAIAFFRKPFDVSGLIDVVGSCLGHPASTA